MGITEEDHVHAVGSVGFEAEMPSDNPADPFRRDALARIGMEDDELVGDLLQAQWRPAVRSLTSAASALSFIPIGNKITRRGSSTENRPAAKSFRI